MPLFLIIGSAVIFYLAFPNCFSFYGSFLSGWLFAVPFFFALDGKPLLTRSVCGFLWGILAHGLLAQWLFPVTFWGAVIFVLALAVQGALFAAFFFRIRSRGLVLFYAPCLWIVSEWLRAKMMGGWLWSLGYSQSFHPVLIQSAAVGGAWAVSWIMMFVNTALYLALRDRQKRLCFSAIGAGVFLLNLCYGTFVLSFSPPENGPRFRVHAIQPNITREVKTDVRFYDDNSNRHLFWTGKSVVLQKPDLVVWPETAFVDDILEDPVWRPKMGQVARTADAPILFGSALLRGGKDINAALLVSPDGTMDEIYDKNHLVPFSEARPRSGVARRVYAALKLKGYDFQAGRGPGTFVLSKSVNGQEVSARFGVVICSEDGYPDLFRALARQGAGAVVVMLNDGWFRDPRALVLHAQQSVFRAVESGRSVVRSANTGWTVAFDGHGRKMGPRGLSVQTAGFANFDVSLASKETWYAKFGDFFVWSCLVFVIIIASLKFIRERSSHA